MARQSCALIDVSTNQEVAEPGAARARARLRAHDSRRGARTRPTAPRGAAAASKQAAATGRARAVAAKRASNAKFSGKRNEEIVKLVGRRPRITVAELGKELKVDPTGLYRAIRRLQAQGHIEKQGAQLTLSEPN